MPKKIGVIGGGATGLVTVKELKNAGYDVVAFEMLDYEGGAFYTAYPGCVLTTSSVLTPYSDFYRDTKPGKFWTAKEYVEYMHDYAVKNDIHKYYHFSAKAVDCKFNGQGQGWNLTVEHKDKGIKNYHLDYLICATGTNQTFQNPRWENDTSFMEAGGRIIHSLEFEGPDSESVKGKRILVVGSGESAADILHLTSAVAEYAYVSVRSKPAHIIPRLAGPPATPHIADLDTTRYTHSIARSLCPTSMWLRWKRRHAHGVRSGNKVLQKMAEINLKHGTNVFNTFTNKSAGIIKAIVENGAQVVGNIVRMDGKTVTFGDGVTKEFDLIVCCTGFTTNYDWLTNALTDNQMQRIKKVRNLYRHCFLPELGFEFFMCGYARPGVGNTSTLSELQARWFCMLLDGSKVLPSQPEMKKSIVARQMWMENQYGHSARRIQPLVDFLYYLDELSEDIGVRPKLNFFRDFSFAMRTMKVPINGAQFRLVGPGAKPELARNHLLTMPVSNFIDTALMLLANISVYMVLPPLPGLGDPLRPVGAVGDFTHSLRRIMRIVAFFTFSLWYYQNRREKVDATLEWLIPLLKSRIGVA